MMLQDQTERNSKHTNVDHSLEWSAVDHSREWSTFGVVGGKQAPFAAQDCLGGWGMEWYGVGGAWWGRGPISIRFVHLGSPGPMMPYVGHPNGFLGCCLPLTEIE